MDILCETHLPPKYLNAINNKDNISVTPCTNYLSPEAKDKMIAEFAEQQGYVVFTRDSDFFKLATQYDCGVLYLYMKRDPRPGRLVESIEKINDFYTNPADIEESIPGNWA